MPVAKHNGRPTPAIVLIKGVPTHSKQGTFYLEWRQDGERKQQPVGRSPREALNAWNIKMGLLQDSDTASVESSVRVENPVIATACETFLRDLLMHSIGLHPQLGQATSDKILAVATIYRSVYSILGSYIAARLAPYQPMLHALWGGVIGFVLAIIGAVTTWNRGPAFGPHWYPIALIITALPSAWAGGKLFRDENIKVICPSENTSCGRSHTVAPSASTDSSP